MQLNSISLFLIVGKHLCTFVHCSPRAVRRYRGAQRGWGQRYQRQGSFHVLVSSYPEARPSCLQSQSRWLQGLQKCQGLWSNWYALLIYILDPIADKNVMFPGNGVTDDTNAINAAIQDGARCGQGCDSSTIVPAVIYFPAGTYLVSRPIVAMYYSQLVGDPLNWPTIKGAPGFQGIALLDSDPYLPGGANWVNLHIGS